LKASKPLGVPLNPMQRQALRDAAMAAGSQSALARRLGYSAKSISGWIGGALNPSAQVLDVLAAAGIDLSG
jgi:DNA-binding transcriptional regulator YdaS (Cro superfamily)